MGRTSRQKFAYRERNSIFDEVDRELSRARFRRSGPSFFGILVSLLALVLVIGIVVGVTTGGYYWFQNAGPTGEVVFDNPNTSDRVDIWQTEPRSSDKVWN